MDPSRLALVITSSTSTTTSSRLKTDEFHYFLEEKNHNQNNNNNKGNNKTPQTKTFDNSVFPRVIVAIKHVQQKSNTALRIKAFIFLLIFTCVSRKLHKTLGWKMHGTKLKV